MTNVRFDEQGIIPAVVQEKTTREVLLLAYMNAAALEASQQTGRLHLWSRSRQALWLKGERSGNYQLVDEIMLNCEGNSLLVLVHSQGPACHDGYASCFYRRLDNSGDAHLDAERLFDPASAYGEQPIADSGREEGLEQVMTDLWRAYSYLLDNDLRMVSSTSQLLHEADIDYLRTRLAEELSELGGVVAGKHTHSGLPADIILEGSQVCYWACILALKRGVEYDSLLPHALLSHAGRTIKTHAELEQWTVSLIDQALHTSTDRIAGMLQDVFKAVGECCRLHQVDVRSLIQYDLDQMETRSYLMTCFPSRSGSG